MKKTINFAIRHIVLLLLATFWLIPIVWLVGEEVCDAIAKHFGLMD